MAQFHSSGERIATKGTKSTKGFCGFCAFCAFCGYSFPQMKLAILGTRGIPANYGGFETFAEELGTRLAARGHDMTVYGRSNNIKYPHRTYKGVKLAILPTIGTKHLDTVAHTFLSVLHA